jgi:hypothetical protein
MESQQEGQTGVTEPSRSGMEAVKEEVRGAAQGDTKVSFTPVTDRVLTETTVDVEVAPLAMRGIVLNLVYYKSYCLREGQPAQT